MSWDQFLMKKLPKSGICRFMNSVWTVAVLLLKRMEKKKKKHAMWSCKRRRNFSSIQTGTKLSSSHLWKFIRYFGNIASTKILLPPLTWKASFLIYIKFWMMLQSQITDITFMFINNYLSINCQLSYPQAILIHHFL